MTPNTKLALDGTEQTITEWALDYGLTPEIIIARIARGTGNEAAITTPMRTGHAGQKLPIFHVRQKARDGRAATPITVNGVTRTRREWADALGISYRAFIQRVARHGPANAVERALAKRQRAIKQGQTPGVVNNFAQVLGTGAGSTAQDTTNIDFHKDTENADCNG